MNTPAATPTMICTMAALAALPLCPNPDDRFARYYSQDIYQQQFADSTLVPCSILNRRSDILQSIEALRKEYAKSDWDGYGANPVSHQSIHHALCFVSHLPDTIEEPDVGCDADGEVTLEWYHDRNSQCLLTFGSDATIYCNQMAKGARVAAQYRLSDFDRIMSFVYEVASNA